MDFSSPLTPRFDRQAAARTLATFGRVGLLAVLSVSVSSIIGAVTGLKTSFLFKDQLHLTAGDLTTLGIFLGIPGYLQPFMGTLADLYPLFGYHRRSYFVLASLIEVTGYLVLASMHQYHYFAVAGLALVLGSGGTLLWVTVNTVLVTIGNRTGTFYRLQSLLGLVPLALSIAYTAHLSGYVAEHWSFAHVFGVAALLALLRAPAALLIDEQRAGRHSDETEEAHATRSASARSERREHQAALRLAVASPGLWAVIGFVFYLILTPGVNTAQFYYQVDVLHLSKQFLGDLGRWGAAGTLLALALFGLGAKRLPVRGLVWGAWLMDCCTYLVTMQLHDARSACLVALCGAFIGTLYGLCLNTLAARACPPGIEGTVYGAALAAIALAGALSEKFGSWLYDFFGPRNHAHHYTIAHGWFTALWIGFVFTVGAAFFIPFLPDWARSSEAVGAVGEHAVQG